MAASALLFRPDARARLQRTAALCGLVWLAANAVGVFGDLASALVALGAGVVVALGVAASSDGRARGIASPGPSSLAIALGAPAALASFLLPRGHASAALAAVWLVATLVVALRGAARILRRGVSPIEELAIDAGHLYLPVGAIWLVASRAGHELLGFREPIVTYTANHFHFAGFAAPVVIGLLGRELCLRPAQPESPAAAVAGGPPASAAVRAAFTIAASIVIAGIPLVAAGILLSHTLEMPAAILLGSGMLGCAVLLARAGLRRARTLDPVLRVSGGLLVLSACSLVLSMSLVVAFATSGSATRGAAGPGVPFSTMVRYHGAANAIGFALCALLAFSIRPAATRVRPR